jgi:hypothetical protein
MTTVTRLANIILHILTKVATKTRNAFAVSDTVIADTTLAAVLTRVGIAHVATLVTHWIVVSGPLFKTSCTNTMTTTTTGLGAGFTHGAFHTWLRVIKVAAVASSVRLVAFQV